MDYNCCRCTVNKAAVKTGPGDGVIGCCNCGKDFCRECSWKARCYDDLPKCHNPSVPPAVLLGLE
jgi:hypothetical protein